ncbi:hypothetical protein CRG98_015562 [Punica granatum]|uniref:RNase H type-1 domain-containing protein n=1 Tax=Punica granatum TaxID=22663 RepID=A0A2I0K787_PUNGR|nr:hypothetical protein CRG98_015562 [Punica granatum]
MKAKYGNFLSPSQCSASTFSNVWKGLLSCENTIQQEQPADAPCLSGSHSVKSFYHLDQKHRLIPSPDLSEQTKLGGRWTWTLCNNQTQPRGAIQTTARDDWVQIDTDAAWTIHNTSLAGLMLRQGQPIAKCWLSPTYAISPLQAEAKAVLLAVSVALEHGWDRISLRCDALPLVEAIHRPSSSPWEIKNIISD